MVNCGHLNRDTLRPEQIFNTTSQVDREIDTRLPRGGRPNLPMRFRQHPAWMQSHGPYGDSRAERANEETYPEGRYSIFPREAASSSSQAAQIHQTTELDHILFDPRQVWDNSDENTQHE